MIIRHEDDLDQVATIIGFYYLPVFKETVAADLKDGRKVYFYATYDDMVADSANLTLKDMANGHEMTTLVGWALISSQKMHPSPHTHRMCRRCTGEVSNINGFQACPCSGHNGS